MNVRYDATCHTAAETMQLLRKHFQNRIISRGCDFIWPSHSPDLSCCDFFLWGYLKSKVYANKPRDLAQLRANIVEESAKITTVMTKKVIENFKNRIENCVKNKGGHLCDVIFKTKWYAYNLLCRIQICEITNKFIKKNFCTIICWRVIAILNTIGSRVAPCIKNISNNFGKFPQ